MIVKVRDNQSRYLDTRNLTVESSRKKGEIRGPKDFTGHCALVQNFFWQRFISACWHQETLLRWSSNSI